MAVISTADPVMVELFSGLWPRKFARMTVDIALIGDGELKGIGAAGTGTT